MDLGLEDKIALVAASSRGLGRAIAEEFAAEGATLVMCARGDEELQRVATQIRDKWGGHVLALAADVADPRGVDAVATAAMKAFGRVDILVTNAGGPPPGPFESHTPEAWRAAYALTLESTVNMVRAVLPGMKQRRWGRILNVTSIAVKQPVQDLILSNSLRAAVTGFARTLANEVGAFNITVNNLLPGYTRTARLDQLAKKIAQTENVDESKAEERWTSEIPMRRLGEPSEFAALAAFLASERASYITAQSIAVDGGWIKSLV